jgi:hypothetical protein
MGFASIFSGPGGETSKVKNMFSPQLKSNSLAALAFAGAILMAAAPSGAGPTPAAVPWAGQGCGWGAYRAPNGSCDIVKDPNWRCQAGFHSVPSPTWQGSGYRCVQDGY